MMNKRTKEGFTLVELLIVIALIGILSVAVLATINPIEQANKARDARVQNDAAEVMNAYERYYASLSRYPWMEFDTGGTPLTVTDDVFLRSDTYGFGICSDENTSAALLLNVASDVPTGGCDTGTYTNLLVQTSELKSSFIGKDSFEPVRDTTHIEQALWTVKAVNDNSIYVCYIPKANANQTDSTKLRCLASTTGSVYKIGENSGNCVATVTDWSTPVTDGTEAMFKCVPE